ncbi:MAG TPA: iron-containing alcohol dehydrogenase [Steroidobacteraceae bacterium]
MNWTHTALAQQIRFGPGVVRDLPAIAAELGRRRIMFVTTRGRHESDAGARIMASLGSALVSVFDGVRSHVPRSAVDAALAQARRDNVDCVVSFGGGSCADLGKALCFYWSDQRASTFLDQPALLHIAIPTGYSGAELTAFFGVTDEATRRKTGAGAPASAPRIVLYDPELTLDLPPRISAETGMNALAHCVEAAWSPSRSAEAEVIAYAGAARIGFWLPRVVQDPGDLEARTQMLIGAMFGGRCLQNSSMGVHHGLAQLVGGHTGMPHGLANALILAHAVRFNADAEPHTIWRLAIELGRTDGDAAAAIDDLRARIGLPARLSECGFSREDLDAVVELSEGNANIARNPKPVSKSDVRAILEEAY